MKFLKYLGLIIGLLSLANIVQAQGGRTTMVPSPRMELYLQDPVTASLGGSSMVMPGGISGASRTCEEIYHAMDLASQFGNSRLGGGLGDAAQVQRLQDQARECREEVSDFDRMTVNPIFNMWSMCLNDCHGTAACNRCCRLARSLDAANERRCRLNLLCGITQDIADNAALNADFRRRYNAAHTNITRQLSACALAALELRLFRRGCGRFEGSIIERTHTVGYGATVEEGISIPAVTCTAQANYLVNANGDVIDDFITTNPPFINITGSFNVDEFNIFLRQRQLIDHSGGFTPDQMREYDRRIDACHTPQLPCGDDSTMGLQINDLIDTDSEEQCSQKDNESDTHFEIAK